MAKQLRNGKNPYVKQLKSEKLLDVNAQLDLNYSTNKTLVFQIEFPQAYMKNVKDSNKQKTI